MQRSTRLIALLMAAALAGAGPALAAKKRPVAKKKPAAVKTVPAAGAAAVVAPSSEVELAHRLGPDRAEPLKRLVDRFNAGSERKILLVERAWDAAGLPALMLLSGEDEARFLGGKPRYKPVHQIMSETGLPLQTLKPPPVMDPTPLDASGKVMGLPIGLGTPIMYFNRDAFRKAGLDADKAPATWWDLQQALGKLYDAGVACPYTSSYPQQVHVENTSTWHNEAVAASGKREGPLSVNNLVMVKHLAMMSSWYKSRYMHLFGQRDEADAKFALGECAVLTAPSDSFPTLSRFAKFEIGMAPLPYHDDVPGSPQNTLADGSVLWAASGRTPEDYKLIAQFVAFLLTPETQVEWQVNGGYLPLNRAGLLASRSELLKEDLANVRIAIDQLSAKAATPTSGASRYGHRADVRRIVSEEMEAVWRGTKPAKAALDTAVARSRNLK